MVVTSATALVTGANRGIGRALVAALLQAGARRVYAAARDPSALPDFRDARVVPLRLDVTDTAQVAEAAARAEDVNLLINNAGVFDAGGPLDMPVEAIERNFRTNVLGTLHVARAFAPVIERQDGGTIVNLLSIVSFAAMPLFSGYSASKAASWSITQSLRAALAPKGIAVLGVFPGPIDTDMAKSVTLPKTGPDQAARAIVDGIRAGAEDILPDPMGEQVYVGWKADPKALEKQMGAV
jgi:NAD(P)-dependent dehydrogenase (short-subunit alcohol dehydrogenase family)